MDIAILDGDCFSLMWLKFSIENDLKMNCGLATQSESEFISAIDIENLVDGAIIHFDHKCFNTLLAINQFILKKGSSKLIVMLEVKSKDILNLMRCLGVVWVVFRGERIDLVRKLTRDAMLLIANAYVTESENHCERDLLTQREIMVMHDLLNGLTISEMAKKRFLSIKTISAHKCNAMRKIGCNKINKFFKRC
ncbi:helix-turn-helix transcriptional regulator [Serratia marcescens]|uniref:helix-turn-helix transcriptional regulator n=1 Tax=Serratia marcescens TaxID=615 RepID=UPI001745E0EA